MGKGVRKRFQRSSGRYGGLPILCPRSTQVLMADLLIKLAIMGAMLVGLPLVGRIATGSPVDPYLQFPPHTRFLHHHPFSWAAFATFGLFLLVVTVPLAWCWVRGKPSGSRDRGRHRFPWWGWVGVVAGAGSWILAWTRFPWFSPLQPHTFTPLWMSYIVVINGLAYARRGHCMMTDRPWFFAALFPVSALFWWFFEYLNRYVQNWYYVGADFGAWEYFWYATLPFSTVLPAVLGTRDLISANSRLEDAFERFWVLRPSRSRVLAWAALLGSAAGLAAVGVWPDYLFPLLWISPLLIIVSLQHLMGEPHLFQDLARGDWRLVISSAVAALVCGIFWEMWNYFSLAKWEYAIPLVNRYPIFEMPVLGYGGYLPFGLECAVIGEMVGRFAGGSPKAVPIGPYKYSP